MRESTSPLFLLLDIVGELFEVHEFVGEVLAAVPLKPVALPLLAHAEVGTARLLEETLHLQKRVGMINKVSCSYNDRRAHPKIK